jgi:hypothetical protein
MCLVQATPHCVRKITLIISFYLRLRTNIECDLCLANFRTDYTHSVIENTQSMDRRFSENYSLLIYFLLSPWSKVLLEKLTGLQLVKKFPSFYEARRFITAFTSARKLSLS